MQILNHDMSPIRGECLDAKIGKKCSFVFQPSGFIAQFEGGFRRINIRQMKPMVGRKVVDTLLVAQAKTSNL